MDDSALLEELLTLSRALSPSLDPEVAVASLVRVVRQATGSEATLLERLDDDWRSLAGQGSPDTMQAELEQARTGSEPLLLDGRRLLVPLNCRAGNAIHVLYLEQRERYFEERDFRILEALSPQMSAYLDHVHQYHRQQESFARERKARSSQLAGMSHDLRTPMNAVLGFCQLLIRHPDTSLSHLENLRLIEKNGELLLKMIDQVVELARLDARLIQIVREEFNLHDRLRELETTLGVQASAKGLELHFQWDTTLPRSILADPARFSRALTTLLEQAIERTPAGSVLVKLSGLPAPEGEGTLIRCTIEDGGLVPGEEQLTQLFEPHGGSHSQLGLAIARHYARLMGGDLSAHPLHPGRAHGLVWCAEFTVGAALESVTSTAAAPAQTGKIVALAAGVKPPRILIADDVIINRFLLKSLLGPIGFELREARDGEEALQIYSDWQPHATLMDLMMPKMDGSEAIRRIRALPGGEKTVLIAVTGNTEEGHGSQGLPIDAHMTKPVEVQQLLETLGKLLQLSYAREGVEADPIAPSPDVAAAGCPDIPENLRIPLQEACELGDVATAAELLGRMKEHPGLQEFAQRCQQLADDFEFAALIRLLAGVASL